MKLNSLFCSFLFLLNFASNSYPAEEFTDEKAIRDIVRQENDGKIVIDVTERAIFVSDRVPSPIIGWKPTKKEDSKSRDERMGRPNQKRKSEIVRLIVSKSGDMAEEFGNFTISWDGPDKQKTSFDGSYLRVWHKVNGSWKVDAFFARPNRQPEP